MNEWRWMAFSGHLLGKRESLTPYARVGGERMCWQLAQIPPPTTLLRGMVGGGLIDIGWRIRERGVRSENAAFVFHPQIFRILSHCAKGRRIAPVLSQKRKRKVIEQLYLTCQMRSRMENLGPGGKSVYSGQGILALTPPLFSHILDILSPHMALPPPKKYCDTIRLVFVMDQLSPARQPHISPFCYFFIFSYRNGEKGGENSFF